VDRSGSTYNASRRGPLFSNPTNAVGGSFRLYLQREQAWAAFFKSHQRSWWIVQALPTSRAGVGRFFQIPPTQLVDRSGSTYKASRPFRLYADPEQSTNFAGGILHIHHFTFA
jgi:hypothetical protein